MNIMKNGRGVLFNAMLGKDDGLAALTFGAGVLLCLILPSGALVCVEAALIVAAGAALFIK